MTSAFAFRLFAALTMGTHSRPRLLLALTRALFLSVALTASVYAQVDPSNAATSSNAHSVSGVVVNSVTGEPIRRALVQLSGPPAPLTVLTGQDGQFQFSGVIESDVVIAARKPGFFTDDDLHPEFVQQHIVHLGANTESLTLKLSPEGSVTGHVATVKGEPLDDTPVRVFQQRIVDGRKRWEQHGPSATTDEDGQFRVGNLVAGDYLLVAGPNLSLPPRAVTNTRTPVREGFGPVFFPGVPELESASLLTVGAGQQAQGDFSVKTETIYKVKGEIGNLPGPASIQLRTRVGDMVNTAVSMNPQTGKFDFRIPAGSYVLQANAVDTTGQPVRSDFPLTVTSDIANLSLALTSSPTLTVRIDARKSGKAIEEGGASGQDRLGAVYPDSATFFGSASFGQIHALPVFAQITLTKSDPSLQPEVFQAVPDPPNTNFVVRDLSPGKYSVQILPPPPWYVQSATSGTVDILRDDLVIVPGRRPEPLDIVLRDDGATLSGKIVDNGAGAPGFVVLIPDQGSPDQIRTSNTGSSGEFQLSALAPGDYKLLALDRSDAIEFRRPEVLAPYLSKAVRVVLRAGEQTDTSVERIPVGSSAEN